MSNVVEDKTCMLVIEKSTFCKLTMSNCVIVGWCYSRILTMPSNVESCAAGAICEVVEITRYM